ncbi:IS4-like element ISGvi2 family transposase [Gloeobacter violaceus]|uniref:Gll0371 protein n=1 Tax=Gloeobacter violaceus (strain ATCC 29082 / PCC 7421) TaxID=251221 RepID=Q7M7G3_GLOVI|nr:IS4-like element ISGvi2 family transposase [Gloeobacter violaceus]BAC88087.1 glr0146 [Gloeobacter violaceus PCC 7421]BAC88312.1 gll0371 [Gloeobacter violaceus PCC 7421]
MPTIDPWTEHELQHLDLGDARRHTRLKQLLSSLARQPHASLPQACEDAAALKAAYRFLDNPQCHPADIRQAHASATAGRLAALPLVLLIQDTTELNFTAHPHTTGLGHLSKPESQGLLVHSLLAVRPDAVALGLCWQKVWTRAAQVEHLAARRQKRPQQHKESQRWLDGLAAAKGYVPPGGEAVLIGDRESDMFGLFAAPRPPQLHLLVRAARQRRLATPKTLLFEVFAGASAQGHYRCDLARRPGRAARQARLQVYWQAVQLQPGRNDQTHKGQPPVSVWVVRAWEVDPPAGEEGIDWWLLSSQPVTTLEQALACVHRYTLRWLIERYHYILKSGCAVEQLQLETAQRLERALAVYCIVAWRLLQLTYQSRSEPELPCTVALAQHEWQALYCRMTQSRQLPEEAPSLRQAVRWIAQLGGFVGRKGDGEPGVKTLWRGWQRLEDLAAGWLIARSAMAGDGNEDVGNG